MAKTLPEVEKWQLISAKLMDSGVDNESTADGIAKAIAESVSSSFRDMQCNYTAMMYLITEQHALIGTLLQELIENGHLRASSLEKVTSVYGDREILAPVYTDLYRRFIWYFERTKETLANEDNKEGDKPNA